MLQYLLRNARSNVVGNVFESIAGVFTCVFTYLLMYLFMQDVWAKGSERRISPGEEYIYVGV